MRFYATQHQYYCGIDLHAKKMYVCIMDREGTGRSDDYGGDWRKLKKEWGGFQQKAEASSRLSEKIESCGLPLHPRYPFETKIMELCCIGENELRRTEHRRR